MEGLDYGGAWVTQSVKYLSLDFSSGHDLTVCGIGSGPASGSALTVWSLFVILSPSLSVPPLLSLSQNKYINIKTFFSLKKDNLLKMVKS